MKKLIFSLVFIMSCAAFAAAQDKSDAAKAESFPYPTVPDTITTEENRFSYFVAHMWDNLNFSKPIAGSQSFIEAMETYVQSFAYAHPNVVTTSVRAFMNKALCNTKNFEAIMTSAEYFLFNPFSQYANDAAFTLFATEFVKNKKASKEMREHIQELLGNINMCQIGKPFPNLSFTDIYGKKTDISSIESPFTLIYINPVVDDNGSNSITRVRLSTDANVNESISNGHLKVLCLSDCKHSKEWAAEAEAYNKSWIVAATENLKNVDIRFTPCFFLLDKDKKLVYKNITIDTVKALRFYYPSELQSGSEEPAQ